VPRQPSRRFGLQPREETHSPTSGPPNGKKTVPPSFRALPALHIGIAMSTPFAIAASTALSSRSIAIPGGLLRLDALPETDAECTVVMVKAMATRITDLQKELVESRKRALVSTPHTEATAVPAAKKAKAVAPPPSNSGMVKKRLATMLKQALKGQKFFGHCTEREAKFDDVVTEVELREIFLNGPEGARGTLIQPTPTNNPKSQVFIIEVSGSAFEKIADVSGLKGELWRKGEIGRFGAVTSKKLGSIPLSVRSATIKWSKNQSKLSVNAQLASSSAGSSMGYCDSDDDGMYGSFM